jgi:hypothetical protein
MEETSSEYNFWVIKPEGMIPLERPLYMWEINIKMDLKETGRENVCWSHLAYVGSNGRLL